MKEPSVQIKLQCPCGIEHTIPLVGAIISHTCSCGRTHEIHKDITVVVREIPHQEERQAYADGKTVQACSRGDNCWVDCATKPSFHRNTSYRVKPEALPGLYQATASDTQVCFTSEHVGVVAVSVEYPVGTVLQVPEGCNSASWEKI